MSRKVPTPIRSTPSSAPFDSITASQRAHISELVQKTHTLEQKSRKLEESLQQQADIHKEKMDQAYAEWQAERVQWKDGCDSLQAFHRIAHLRTTALLEDERLAILKEHELSRKQRMALFQRDYQLTMFQAKETELEAKIDELEESLERNKQKSMQMVLEWKAKVAGILEDVKEKAELLAEAEAARSSAQEETSRLREEQSVLKASVATATSEHERTKHRLRESENTHADLKHKCQELEQANAELKSQVEKWRNSESKGGAEVNAERKKRIELEVEVTELKGRLASMDEKLQGEVAATEKGQRKIEKLKEGLIDQARQTAEAEQRLTELQEQFQAVQRANKQLQQTKDEQAHQLATSGGEGEQDAKHKQMMSKLTKLLERQARETAEAKQTAMKNEKEAEQVRKQLSEALKRNEELKAKSRTPHVRSPAMISPQSVATPEPARMDSPTIPNPEIKGRPQPRPMGRKSGFSATAKMMEDASPPRAKKASIPIDSDIEEISPIPAKVKTKKTRSETPIEDAKHEDVVKPKNKKPPSSKSAATADRKGKRKVVADEDEEDAEAVVVKPKRRKKAVNVETVPSDDEVLPRGKPAKKARQASKAASVQDSRASGTPDDETSAPKKRKLRKLNAFSSAQPQTFDWMRMGTTGDGLDIPRELSPIKNPGPVPQRSLFGGGRISSRTFSK